MKDEEYELVPINPIKKLQKKIKELEEGQSTELPMKELRENLEELNEQVSKLVTVNINLQSKITELLIKTTEQIEQSSEMIELLREASEVEAGPEKELKIDLSPMVNELRTISAQNEEIKNGFAELTNFMRTMYRRDKISQVAQTPPAPSGVENQ